MIPVSLVVALGGGNDGRLPLIVIGVWQVMAAFVLFAAGFWGWRNATRIVPASLSGAARQRRVRSLLRGAVTCQVLGVLCLVCAVLAFIR